MTHCAPRIPGTTREEVDAAIREAERELAERPSKAAPELESRTPRSPHKRHEADRTALAERLPYPAERVALFVLTSYACEHERDVEAVDRLAHLHFELNHFAEAAVRFRQVVRYGHPEDPRVLAAFVLEIETMNVLGSYFARTTCFDDMERSLPYAVRHLCAFEVVERQPERAAKCALIRRIAEDFERLEGRQRQEERERQRRRALD